MAYIPPPHRRVERETRNFSGLLTNEEQRKHKLKEKCKRGILNLCQKQACKLLEEAGTVRIPNLFTMTLEGNSTACDITRQYCDFKKPTRGKRNNCVEFQINETGLTPEQIREVEKIKTKYNEIWTFWRPRSYTDRREWIDNNIGEPGTPSYAGKEPLREAYHRLLDRVIELEDDKQALFNVPKKLTQEEVVEAFGSDYAGNINLINRFKREAGKPNDFNWVNFFDTFWRIDHLQKHQYRDAENVDTRGIGNVHNVDLHLQQYQRKRRNEIANYPNENTDPRTIANQEKWGNINNLSPEERTCLTEEEIGDDLLYELIDPKNEYYGNLPYNRRQYVFGFFDLIEKYINCPKYFRTITSYTRRDLKYNRLINKYFVTVAANTNMVFPIRFILSGTVINNEEEKILKMTKHRTQENIELSKYIGLIKLNTFFNLEIPLIYLCFKSEKKRNSYTGKEFTIKIIDYNLMRIPIGHLTYEKNITFEELNILIKYLKMSFRRLKSNSNIIFFQNNSQYESLDENVKRRINEKLSQPETSLYEQEQTGFLPERKLLQWGGNKKEMEKSINLHYRYRELYNLEILNSHEFFYLLYPYLYISGKNFSGFISYRKSPVNKIYSINTLVKTKDVEILPLEILKYFKINTKNKSILELNNYFPTIINTITNSNKLSLFLYPNIRYHLLDKYNIQQERLFRYYKKYNTRINQEFRVQKIKKQDIIITNLFYMIYSIKLKNMEKCNSKLKKKIFDFVKLNLKKGGTLVMNAYSVATRGMKNYVLNLKRYFKSVKLYHPEIQHVFKQGSTILCCKGFNPKPKKLSKDTTFIDKYNKVVYTNKIKFYRDIFIFYEKFVKTRNIKPITDKQKKFQMVMSYLYAKEWDLDFKVKIDKKFKNMLKRNIKYVLKQDEPRYSFRLMKSYYNKFPKNRRYKTIDTKELGEYLETVENFKKVHKHKNKNVLTKNYKKDICKNTSKTKIHKLYLDMNNIKEIWKLYLKYSEIIIYRPQQLLEPNAYYVICRGKEQNNRLTKRYEKYFAEKVKELMKEMIYLYSRRLTHEVDLLKYKKDLTKLL